MNGEACTDTDSCVTKCFDTFTITFDRPIYLQSLSIMGGLKLKETTDQAENNCYFKPKVMYNKDITSVDKISGTIVVSIKEPADRIELQSKCSNHATCVFTVETFDVAEWPVRFQGTKQISFYF